ncbi:MAG: hypothetical protein AAGC55_02885 [Myxococcota bacterium]
MTPTHHFPIAIALISAAAVAGPDTAHADEGAGTIGKRADSGLAWDIEVDPIAYALEGYSFHVAIGWDRVRLDLGAFGLAIPEAFHSNEGVDGSFRGFGAKLDLFPWARQRGAFIGVQTGISTLTAREKASGVSADGTAVEVSVRVGYRFELAGGFFVSPWIGIGYARGDDITVGESTWETNPLIVFPTVHIGYRGR